MTSPCALFLLAALADPQGLLVVDGNVALTDEVYAAVADLAPGAAASAETAALVERRAAHFLERSGYVLARVQARAAGDRIHLHVDEGRLALVTFRGRLTVKAVRYRLAFELPEDVFNAPYLERHLRELDERFGLDVPTRYELVERPEVADPWFQVDLEGFAREAIGGERPDAGAPAPVYELHIILGTSRHGSGLGLEVHLGGPEGLELGFGYGGGDTILQGDRWSVDATGGAWLRDPIDAGSSYLAFTRAFLGAEWEAPGLFGGVWRPGMRLRGDLTSFQRSDLRLETYRHVDLDASLLFGFEPHARVHVAAGGGLVQRYTFDLDTVPVRVHAQAAPPPPSLVPFSESYDASRLQAFAEAHAQISFDREEVRRDQRHLVELLAVHRFGVVGASSGEARFGYRKTFHIGWDELRLRARGIWMWGDVLFHDEEPVGGRHTRGVHGHLGYVERLLSGAVEYRLSITRDLYKVSLFHDAAVYGALDRRVEDIHRSRIALAGGPGFHALIEGLLQLDLYASIGYGAPGLSIGLSLQLRKVY